MPPTPIGLKLGKSGGLPFLMKHRDGAWEEAAEWGPLTVMRLTGRMGVALVHPLDRQATTNKKRGHHWRECMGDAFPESRRLK